MFWSLKLNFENFKMFLNDMPQSIKFTFEKLDINYENEQKVEVLNFLHVKIILNEDNSIKTDIYYKPTNTHNYLPKDLAKPNHTKNNIHYKLAITIITFVCNSEEIIIFLVELRQFLTDCKYLEHVTSKTIFNTELQGPAQTPRELKILFLSLQPIILISTTDP